MQNKKASKMKNISFGKLKIGADFKKRDSKEAIFEFIRDDDSLATRFSVLCDIMDENTGNDIFTLEASNNKNTNYTTFKLSAKPTHLSRNGENIPDKINIFKETVNTYTTQDEKRAFIEKMYVLFMKNIQRGQYSIYKLSNNCAPKNPTSNLTFIATKSKIENLLELTKEDKNLSDELALTFKKIDEALKRNEKLGELTVKRSSYKEAEKNIIITLSCESGEKITTSINLETDKEEKSKELKRFVQNVEKKLDCKRLNTNKKLTSAFDKYY